MSPSTIRNISQTVQEREIIKTAPDVVVFIDGLPYLTNLFINDPRTGADKTIVNFNDHVTTFSATYDTESLVPNCTIGLQVPNFEKFLFQQPGGNNLFQTMSQVQVYAKSYWMSSVGDTVYRRVFKGVLSYIGYNDNGKTLEISLQCQGIMQLLQHMQVNIHPSANTATKNHENMNIMQSIYANHDPYSVLAQIFTDAFRSDSFQMGSLKSDASDDIGGNPFYASIRRGYMPKWQAILYNMVKDVHIYGPYKDNLGDMLLMKKGGYWGHIDKRTQAAAIAKVLTKTEAQMSADNDVYYKNITQYLPFRAIAALDVSNNVIVNRLDLVREVVQKIDYEAYQDIDGKIIIKPPLYNLDVVNVGVRNDLTQTQLNSSHNSYQNPATAIYETNNPFIVYLSEMLTEQENEDQSAIRRTRTTVTGNAMVNFGNNYRADLKIVADYTDVTKLAKFGLREEPMYEVPWLSMDSKETLFAHAAGATARANRGYRTYTFTIPMRPELKLGFPVYIPHKDMYAYIKTISLNFDIGGSATMQISCDSLRSRVMINTQQTAGTGNSQQSKSLYTPAPNLVYAWTKHPKSTSQINPSQSLSNTQLWNNPNGNNLIGSSVTLPSPLTNIDGSKPGLTDSQRKVASVKDQNIKATLGTDGSSLYATYVIKNDGDKDQGTIDPKTNKGYFTQQRPADTSYIHAVCGSRDRHTHSVIPYTDDKGYELISPFPWGRWITLNHAIREFTQQGWIWLTTDVNGNVTRPTADDLTIQNNVQAFIFAGLGTPSATNDPSTQLLMQQQSNLINSAASQPTTGQPPNQQQNSYTPDSTVIVLHYDPTLPGSNADKTLLNNPQPENFYAQLQLSGTSNAKQQLVDVLVSGSVAPTPAVQEALMATLTQLSSGQTIKITQFPQPAPKSK